MEEWAKIGICDKCGEEDSELFIYGNRWLCKANECYTEEQERDSGIHITREKKLQDYINLVSRSG